MTDLKYKRYEKSLGLLTTRFVSLLQKAKDGVLDLKIATNILAVRQKRRIYDITNVLEGIGLIEKRSKNSVQWKGAAPDSKNNVIGQKVSLLRRQISKLEEREQTLDLQLRYIEQSIKNVLDEADNTDHCYVADKDIESCFEEEQVLVLEASLGTCFRVGSLSGLKNEHLVLSEQPYYLHVKSSESIGVILLCDNEDKDSEDGNMDDSEVQSSLSQISDDKIEEENYLLRLSPPITKYDFSFSLDKSEGLCDLFDIPC